jgi:MFS family permease
MSDAGGQGDREPWSRSHTRRRAERVFHVQVQRNLTRNYLAHLGHGMLGQTGFRLINAPTFLPAYIMLLSGGSEMAVGLALSLQALGMTLTPLLGANLIEHRRRVLPVGMLTGGAMRLMVLGMALSGLLLPPPIALISLLVFMTMLGLFQGMQGVIFNFLMSKVIPVSKRGRLTGLRNFLAGITSAGVAWLGGKYLIGDLPTAAGYSHTFLLAFVLTSFGLLLLLFMREPETPAVKPDISLRERLRQLPAMMKEDPAFSRYVMARALATMGRMAVPFYILHASDDIGLSGATLGIMTFAFMLSGTVSNLLWGALADWRGFRLAFLGAIGLWILASLLLIYSSGMTSTILVFIGIGAAVQGFQNASMNLTLEFGQRADLPVRIAVANTVSEVAGTLGPLLGGVLAAAFGYPVVFATSMAFLIVGGAVVNYYVPEPRHGRSNAR